MHLRSGLALGVSLCKADILWLLLVGLFAQSGEIQKVQSGRTCLEGDGSLQTSQEARILDRVYDPPSCLRARLESRRGVLPETTSIPSQRVCPVCTRRGSKRRLLLVNV